MVSTQGSEFDKGKLGKDGEDNHSTKASFVIFRVFSDPVIDSMHKAMARED